MTVSATKSTMVRRVAENPWLQTSGGPMAAQSDSDFSVDQPAAALAPAIAEYAAATLEQGMTHYADVPGVWALREQLVGFLGTIGMNTFPAANLMVTAGVQESRFLSIQIVGANFDAIGVPTVVAPGARQALAVRAITTVDIPVPTPDLTGAPATESRCLPRIEDLAAALAAGRRLLYLESPSRLTGAVYNAQEVAAIADLVHTYDGAVIWDQGLAPWVQPTDYLSLGALPGMADRVVVLGEAWPGMGLESWMIGYVGANADWLEQMRSQKQIMSICTSVATQYAAIQAAALYAETHSGQLEILGEHRHLMSAALAQMGSRVLPGAAVNLVAVDAGAPGMARLRRSGIAVADGAAFGAPDIARLAIPLRVEQKNRVTQIGE